MPTTIRQWRAARVRLECCDRLICSANSAACDAPSQVPSALHLNRQEPFVLRAVLASHVDAPLDQPCSLHRINGQEVEQGSCNRSSGCVYTTCNGTSSIEPRTRGSDCRRGRPATRSRYAGSADRVGIVCLRTGTPPAVGPAARFASRRLSGRSADFPTRAGNGGCAGERAGRSTEPPERCQALEPRYSRTWLRTNWRDERPADHPQSTSQW